MSATAAVLIEYLAKDIAWPVNPAPSVTLIDRDIRSLTDSTFDLPDKIRPSFLLMRAAERYSTNGVWRPLTVVGSEFAKSFFLPILYGDGPAPRPWLIYYTAKEAEQLVERGSSKYATAKIGQKTLVSNPSYRRSTWFTHDDVASVMRDDDNNDLQSPSPQFMAMLAALRSLEEHFGKHRVRLVFYENVE